MFSSLIYLLLVHSIVTLPHLYLFNTDEENNNRTNISQYHCFHLPTEEKVSLSTFEFISYCLNEQSPKFDIQPTSFYSNYTFAELSKRNITDEDLYSWFASIDLIERYQSYLYKSSIFDGKEIFYNCTEERFGPMCQYELKNVESIVDLINYAKSYYQVTKPFSTSLTCYMATQCNRGLSCLDWSEICDGKIDCYDSSFDEEHCSQVEIEDPIYKYMESILPSISIEDAKCRERVLTS
ncbi:unnamed protein product, partial [Adineta ricciae]